MWFVGKLKILVDGLFCCERPTCLQATTYQRDNHPISAAVLQSGFFVLYDSKKRIQLCQQEPHQTQYQYPEDLPMYRKASSRARNRQQCKQNNLPLQTFGARFAIQFPTFGPSDIVSPESGESLHAALFLIQPFFNCRCKVRAKLSVIPQIKSVTSCI